ncbi:hypothetical protein Y032_0016g3161 [Ancylostoma ceylanicum]|uniref:Uncharacterized protein n=1 Tax=Ancylostoma ceylanicum TaxID=53326 RepID=A0A016V847_9BILA|nr:hypothetical protein Y032_0016g3161 [Ancylostoma ceylanicum]
MPVQFYAEGNETLSGNWQRVTENFMDSHERRVESPNFPSSLRRNDLHCLDCSYKAHARRCSPAKIFLGSRFCVEVIHYYFHDLIRYLLRKCNLSDRRCLHYWCPNRSVKRNSQASG